ncbi:MAG: hypothetical protein M1539_04255 [Actinobacteria bacterium]|nr:hypothetical protein [Actinomycetota bacterium]MCL5883171.1 hypothetical protein [Actinomycetota bacterium]
MESNLELELTYDFQSYGGTIYLIRACGYAGDKDEGDNGAKSALGKKIAGGIWAKLTSGAGSKMIDLSGEVFRPAILARASLPPPGRALWSQNHQRFQRRAHLAVGNYLQIQPGNGGVSGSSNISGLRI